MSTRRSLGHPFRARHAMGRDSNGALTVPCLSSREACMSGRSNKFWACSTTTRLFESTAQATLAKTGRNSTTVILAAVSKQVCGAWWMASPLA
jgi:hypothetical protein